MGGNQVKGLSKSGTKWRVRIGIDCKNVYLGTFATVAEATAAYDEAAKNRIAKPIRSLIGQKFGRLEVDAFAGKDSRGRNFWHCVCECGGTTTTTTAALEHEDSKSCGCLKHESDKTHSIVHGYTAQSATRLARATYQAWTSMINRCTNQNYTKWEDYGGRGWLNSFENFLADMGEKPSPELSPDRFPNNDGNYEPGNVRWATDEQQNNNRRAFWFVRAGQEGAWVA
jgi:hypothetical protein